MSKKCKIVFNLLALLFTFVAQTSLAQFIQNKEYYIISKHSGKSLDISGGSKESGVELIQWDRHRGPNQIFSFEPAADGSYYIVVKHSGKVLDVAGVSCENGATVCQWDLNNGHNQMWKITQDDDGYFQIKANHSGKVLDIFDLNHPNDARIIQWDANDSNNQKFSIIPVSEDDADNSQSNEELDDSSSKKSESNEEQKESSDEAESENESEEEEGAVFDFSQMLATILQLGDQEPEKADTLILKVMGQQLKEDSQALVEKLQDDHRNEIEALFDGETFPQQQEINRLKAELREKKSRYSEVLKAKQRQLRERVSEFNQRVNRYKDLAGQREEARASYERAGSSAQAEASRISEKIQSNLNRVSEIAGELVTILKEGKDIQDRLERIVESANNGDHSLAREIEHIQDEFNRYVSDKQRQIDSQIADFERERDSFNQTVRDAQQEIRSYNEEARDAQDNLNDNAREINRLADEYNNNPCHYILEDRRELVDHHSSLERDFNYAKNQLERKSNELQSQINHEKASVESHQRQLNSDIESTKRKIRDRKSESQRRADSLKEDIRSEIRASENELKGIKSDLDSNYGPDYGKILDCLNKLSTTNDVTEAAQIVCGIRNKDAHPKSQEVAAHMLAAQMNHNEIQNLKRGLNQKLSHLRSIEESLRQFSNLGSDKEGLASLEREIASDAVKYSKELDGLVDRINSLHQELAASGGSKFQELAEILRLQVEILRREVNLIYALIHISFASPDIIANARDSYSAAVTNLQHIHDRSPAANMIASCSSISTGDQNLDHACFSGLARKSSSELEGDAKTSLLKSWYNTLSNHSFFQECTTAMCNVFSQEEAQVRSFLAGLFVSGLSDRSTVSKIVFENDDEGYQLVIDGHAFWLDEDGNLETVESVSTKNFYPYEFETPADSPLGMQLRNLHKAMSLLFGAKFDQFEEAKQFSVLHTLSLIEIADKIQDEQTKQEAILFAEGMVSIVLGFTPAGPIVGCMEFLSGKDVFGNELSETQRYIALGASVGLHPKLLVAVKNLIGPISKKIFSAFSKENKLSNSYSKMIEVSHSAKKYGFKSPETVQNFAKNLRKSPDSNFSHVLYPRGPGASTGPVPEGYTKVSRWIGDGEVKLWHQGGGTRIPPKIGRAHV